MNVAQKGDQVSQQVAVVRFFAPNGITTSIEAGFAARFYTIVSAVLKRGQTEVFVVPPVAGGRVIEAPMFESDHEVHSIVSPEVEQGLVDLLHVTGAVFIAIAKHYASVDSTVSWYGSQEAKTPYDEDTLTGRLGSTLNN